MTPEQVEAKRLAIWMARLIGRYPTRKKSFGNLVRHVVPTSTPMSPRLCTHCPCPNRDQLRSAMQLDLSLMCVRVPQNGPRHAWCCLITVCPFCPMSVHSTMSFVPCRFLVFTRSSITVMVFTLHVLGFWMVIWQPLSNTQHEEGARIGVDEMYFCFGSGGFLGVVRCVQRPCFSANWCANHCIRC